MLCDSFFIFTLFIVCLLPWDLLGLLLSQTWARVVSYRDSTAIALIRFIITLAFPHLALTSTAAAIAFPFSQQLTMVMRVRHRHHILSPLDSFIHSFLCILGYYTV